MRILVTGMRGFTGRYMQDELLKHGHTVVGLQSCLSDSDSLLAEVKSVRPEAVIHLAGIAFVVHGNARAIYDVNLLGTRNLLGALSSSNVNIHSVLLASSANVYGNRSSEMLTESCLPMPQTDYAVSKYAMEHMARLFETQLPITIVRPFNYTGVGQNKKFVIPKIVSHFRSKKSSIELGSLDVHREFGDVRCVAYAYRKLFELSPHGEIFNVCTSKPYTLHDVLKLLSDFTNHDVEVEVNPKFIRENEVRILAGNSQKLDNLIGQWRTRDLPETLEWMVESVEDF